MPKATNASENSEHEATIAAALDATVSTEIANRPQYQSADMRKIQSFDDALALMQEQGIPIDDATEAIGDGFVLLDKDDKRKLAGIPCLFMTWSFQEGDHGEFVAARIIAKLDNGSTGKYVVIDGSTGIYEQLRDYTRENGGNINGLIARGGLRPSDYEKEVDGKMIKATTYYIDTSTK